MLDLTFSHLSTSLRSQALQCIVSVPHTLHVLSVTTFLYVMCRLLQ